MQTATGEDWNKSYYEFVYIEKLKKIFVWKDKQFKYIITIDKNNNLTCNCWGFKGNARRSKIGCRHTDFCVDCFKFNKAIKPKTWIEDINEEYIIMWFNNSYKENRDGKKSL